MYLLSQKLLGVNTAVSIVALFILLLLFLLVPLPLLVPLLIFFGFFGLAFFMAVPVGAFESF